jgi:hypothetical protein
MYSVPYRKSKDEVQALLGQFKMSLLKTWKY